MLLKNTGEKIINIGKDIIMPGEEKEYEEGVIGAGTLKVLIGKGFLSVTKNNHKTDFGTEKAVFDEPFFNTEATAAVDEKKPARGRGSKKSE